MPTTQPAIGRGQLRIEIHQLEGFDHRDKSFNRNVEIWRTPHGYVAYFQYEGLEVQSPPRLRPSEALSALAQVLYHRGITRIRTRLNFKGQRYLAEKLPWVNYTPPSSSKS